MEQIVVDCEWPEYRQAVDRISHFVLKRSAEMFGLGIFENKPLRIKITIIAPPIPQKNLYHTVGKEITICWIRSSEKDPSPAKYMRTLTGNNYGTMVFGLMPELGHAIFPDTGNCPQELPEGLHEGWATFFSWSLIPSVWKELGKKAWPIPHNYFEYEMNRKSATDLDTNEKLIMYANVETFRPVKICIDFEGKPIEGEMTTKELVEKFLSLIET